MSVTDLQVFGRGDRFVSKAVKVESLVDRGRILVPFPTLGENSPPPGALLFEATCSSPPPTQGIDVWVTELPDSFGDGIHTFSLTVDFLKLVPAYLTPDPDVFFYTADCQLIGTAYHTAETESGTIPKGTKYAVTNYWLGSASAIRFQAGSDGVLLAKLPKIKAPVVKGTKTTRVLPGTGVGSGATPGLLALAAAVMLAAWLVHTASSRRFRRRSAG